ncbi:hypothetical protein D1007_52159 [Hordeum vulgare]|nr:hypothetical protein D1007_52159 [Hordeum vulgare]
MILNSSKLSTPSPSRSNRQIMARHSPLPRSAPSLPSIRLRLAGVMHPCPSISYIPNASLSARILCSSSSSPASPPQAACCASSRNSDSLSSPSPSASADATSSSASSAGTSSPSVARMHPSSSAADILPSRSRSSDKKSAVRSPDFDTTILAGWSTIEMLLIRRL